ncbi:hypothetical protein [Desulfosporosinus sp. BICA1-9]|uniref:hypothetical protein n=1 Tax=Desulfosporosinus sp. BICA1-9 TaxID=1531958 RepID=UPI00054BE6B2|nr:hypothetical protein [Desulfosporosinus sp. BICA1-9]KJS49107.1 MAG: hypothetical protein VR66_10345 [Peptococcaceae bacterium BRH_c23]KJS81498.1 MAG: hypothetical protein JL57_26335 [Desulfosporosinus sp. BICA1-9]HBW35228.1 hypothetical protein [Desulfosporosinus sp.]
MKVLVLILVFTGIALLEIPGLLKKKQWAELITSSVLLGIGFLLSLLQTVGVKVPNPNKGIEFLIKLVFQ